MRKTKSVKKKGFKYSPGKGAKARKLKNAQKKAGESEVTPAEDQFIDENTKLDPNGAYEPLDAVQHDIQDELSHMEGFQDYLDECRGNNLTYGDY